jgi:midasin (ATPase involved in ribosome maturation)
MNTQLVNSLSQIILALSDEERSLLKKQIDSQIELNYQPDISAQIYDLENEIKKYETQYKMSSEEFYPKFRAGELGDDIDFFEWSVFYEMWLSGKDVLNNKN